MDAEEFCLRWNNHHHVLVSVLDKLLEKESMCDVTLAADHQFVRVHRLVLCACSNYFEEMLSKQVDKQAFIFLKDVSFPELRALVDYMYKGEVNVSQEQLASFLQTAEALDIKGLAYKEGDQSKFKSGQNARTNAAKRTLSESTSTPSVVSTPSNSQRPENDNISHTPSQNQSSSRPKPPPPKKAHVVPSESPTHPANTDSDDLFVVDTKMESELDSDHMEDQLDNNGPEWASRDCDDDCSTSDNGMISIVPNSTRDITFGPSTSDTRMGDNVAGPSGTQPQANNSSSVAASRGDDGKDNRVICRVCHRTYKSWKNLLQHLRRDNTGCAQPNLISLIQENRRVSYRNYARTLAIEADPEAHQPLIKCPNCHFSYKFKKDLYRHLRMGCDEMTTATTVGSRDGQLCDLPVFRCNFCPYVTFVKSSVLRHVQSVHSN
ncbi:protein tramtrack, beta isoform-like isoform X1 [Daphnia pulex]|uniref:protein tramtrack, beta isoform-like isoform X1 n=1 Tax=Daphnia pulex TaxID=6669 RepID=UPI001EE04BBC|nr:protein tramtrack, beta isoform-like isoform X1 [Daphnia pulex]